MAAGIGAPPNTISNDTKAPAIRQYANCQKSVIGGGSGRAVRRRLVVEANDCEGRPPPLRATLRFAAGLRPPPPV
jgi:hypothetical protein